jgi:hypothetical protein
MQKLSIALLFISISALSCNSPIASKSAQEEEQAKKETPDSSRQLTTISPRISKRYDSTKIESYYPFIIYKDGSHMIAAEIEHKDLFEKYSPIFEQYGYSGNGYSWEGHIKQILLKENPSLLAHLQFDPEAGGFYVFADSEKSQREFATTMSKIFKDIPLLVGYLKAADRSKIDD